MSCPREEREKLEHVLIGPYGVLADASNGRRIEEEECTIRTCFQRDIDRITHSKSFQSYPASLFRYCRIVQYLL